MDYHPKIYLNDVIKFSETEFWYYIFGTDHLLNKKGWKIYIAYTCEYADITLRICLPLLKKLNLHCKYIKSSEKLIELNSGILGYSQIGKCIVIYMPEILQHNINLLMDALRGVIKAYPTPPFLANLSSDPPIFYRFGSYLPTEQKLSDDKKSILDERYKSETRQFPINFRSINEKPILSNIDRLLLRYPVIDIISQRGKGGVFIGINLDCDYYQEVIIKIGYIHGEEFVSELDGAKLIQKEESILNYLLEIPIKNILFPRVITSAMGNFGYAVVQEKCSGINARILLQNHEIKKQHLELIINGIRELNNKNIIWGDAKIDNILIDTITNQIYFIDFETTVINGYNKSHSIETYKFIPNSGVDLFLLQSNFDLINFFVSILFDQKIDNQRKISVKDLTSRSYTDDIRIFSCNFLLDLIK